MPAMGIRICNWCLKIVDNLRTGKSCLMGLCNSLHHCIDGSRISILMCIVGELAVGGSVAVAVGVSDMWRIANW